MGCLVLYRAIAYPLTCRIQARSCLDPSGHLFRVPLLRRDALKKGGDLRKHQMALVPQGQAKGSDEPPSTVTGAFDGPFPIVNGEPWRKVDPEVVQVISWFRDIYPFVSKPVVASKGDPWSQGYTVSWLVHFGAAGDSSIL